MCCLSSMEGQVTSSSNRIVNVVEDLPYIIRASLSGFAVVSADLIVPALTCIAHIISYINFVYVYVHVFLCTWFL